MATILRVHCLQVPVREISQELTKRNLQMMKSEEFCKQQNKFVELEWDLTQLPQDGQVQRKLEAALLSLFL